MRNVSGKCELSKKIYNEIVEKKLLKIEVAVPSSSFSTLLATIDSFVGEGSIPA
jgi:hypothetical protein